MERSIEPGGKRRRAWAGLAAAGIAGLLVASASPGFTEADTGPKAAGALAADEDLARAIRTNDPDGIASWLDKDWAVISATGGVGEGPSIFPNGVKYGVLTRKTFDISEPRVRVYGDVALVTVKVKTSGVFQGKPFDVTERQTDVWAWKDGAWRCVLTHETKMPD